MRRPPDDNTGVHRLRPEIRRPEIRRRAIGRHAALLDEPPLDVSAEPEDDSLLDDPLSDAGLPLAPSSGDVPFADDPLRRPLFP